jgi:hypothetical protein
MTKQNNITVIKVPLSDEEKFNNNKQQIFPRMPRLYLELLENKQKIKQDLVNKDYIPSSQSSYSNKDELSSLKKDKYNEINSYKDSSSYKDKDKDKDSSSYKDSSYKDSSSYKDKDKDKDDLLDKDRLLLLPKDKEKNTENEDNFESLQKDIDNIFNSHKNDDIKNKKYDNEVKENIADEFEKYKNIIDDEYKSNTNKKESQDDVKSPSSDLSDRLKELLNEDDFTQEKKDKYSIQRSATYRSVEKYKEQEDKYSPPLLSELNSKDGYKKKPQLKEINQIYNDQEEEDLKRELMFKIDLLKKSYPNSSVPDFSIHSDYQTMKKTYDSTVRRLTLDNSVSNYKQYLIGGFAICEFLLGNYLGFDMQGFTQQQIISMSSYEVLLIELGEKSYVPDGSKWPVEIRLIGLILFNAAVFILSRIILKKTGSNLMGIINSFNGNINNNMGFSNDNNNATKKKMRPPNINLDEIPELKELNK